MSKVTDRAARVKRLLEDPDLTQAFHDVERALFERFAQVSVEDRETLHELKLMHTLLRNVKLNLEAAIRDGKLEEFIVEQKKGAPFLGDITEWPIKKRA